MTDLSTSGLHFLPMCVGSQLQRRGGGGCHCTTSLVLGSYLLRASQLCGCTGHVEPSSPKGFLVESLGMRSWVST